MMYVFGRRGRWRSSVVLANVLVPEPISGSRQGIMAKWRFDSDDLLSDLDGMKKLVKIVTSQA